MHCAVKCGLLQSIFVLHSAFPHAARINSNAIVSVSIILLIFYVYFVVFVYKYIASLMRGSIVLLCVMMVALMESMVRLILVFVLVFGFLRML